MLELLLLVVPELLLVQVLVVAPPLDVPDPPPSCPPVAAELEELSGAASVPPLVVAPLAVELPPVVAVVAVPAPLVAVVPVPPVVGLPSSELPEEAPDPPPSVTDRFSMPATISHPAAVNALERPPATNNARVEPFSGDPAGCRCGAGLTARPPSGRRSKIPPRRS